jgi:hypothetical protein
MNTPATIDYEALERPPLNTVLNVTELLDLCLLELSISSLEADTVIA